jgi:hypothetical protein
MYIGRHVKAPYSARFEGNLKSSGQIFEESSIVKFNENPCSGRRVVP